MTRGETLRDGCRQIRAELQELLFLEDHVEARERFLKAVQTLSDLVCLLAERED